VSKPVCAKCFDDEDLAQWIVEFNGPRGCGYCKRKDAPTAPIREVASRIRECLSDYYSLAVDNLPYESAEGGYQGTTWDTHDLLFDEVGLDLPRDDGELRGDLPDLVEEQVSCEYDWLSLDYDDELNFEWERFCKFIQHQRRFFFALKAGKNDRFGRRKEWSPLELLSEILELAKEFDLIRILPNGQGFFRARPRAEAAFVTAADLGPPPEELATQSNRMNPPGISMMYVSSSYDTAVAEVRSDHVSVGRFRTNKAIRILDLVNLPAVPGIFSAADRKARLGLSFLHGFARAISTPVERSDKIHVEYIPSQVVTEFFRDARIPGGQLQGVAYRSALAEKGYNIVLFATQSDLAELDGTPVSNDRWSKPNPWLTLEKVWESVHAEKKK
jgi:hypothetical protein